MKLLLAYSLKSIVAKKLTLTLTVIGFGLVVFIFSAVLMLSNGLSETLVDTGYASNGIAIRKGSQTEVTSIIGKRMGAELKTDPAIATDPDGLPLVAGEIMILISQPKRSDLTETSNVPVRGVDSMSVKIRPAFKLVAGRMFNPGTTEVIAGVKVANRFADCGLGETLRFGMRDWNVVGVFEAGGGGFESEIWSDYQQISDAFSRPIYSSMTFQLKSPALLKEMKSRIDSDPRFNLDIFEEREYYAKQSETTRAFIDILGITISIIFSLGAIVGAMITMYAAVANRTVEIGTMRALGFRRRTILTTFLIESIMISLIGGAIGLAGAYFMRFVEVSTTNWDTFAELAFSFEISPKIVLFALSFALVMGIIGGFLPAVRASRLRIINALRGN